AVANTHCQKQASFQPIVTSRKALYYECWILADESYAHNSMDNPFSTNLLMKEILMNLPGYQTSGELVIYLHAVNNDKSILL
uniref:hypothetical protein n=1 Tax=Escherichia coli TaxID=562 RepID=UPI0021E78581